MGRWILIAAFALAGCGSQELPLHGDVTFTAEERAAIERGNVFIAEQLGVEPYGIVWDLPHPSDTSSAGKLVIVRGVPEHGYGGWTGTNAHVVLSPGSGDALAAHEFGHTRGLRHLPADVVGLMNPDRVELKWTDADHSQCIAEGVCKN
jgi:hypothetical protein